MKLETSTRHGVYSWHRFDIVLNKKVNFYQTCPSLHKICPAFSKNILSPCLGG